MSVIHHKDAATHIINIIKVKKSCVFAEISPDFLAELRTNLQVASPDLSQLGCLTSSCCFVFNKDTKCNLSSVALWSCLVHWHCVTTLSRKYIKRERERESIGGAGRAGAANGVKWEPLVKSRAAGGGRRMIEKNNIK